LRSHARPDWVADIARERALVPDAPHLPRVRAGAIALGAARISDSGTRIELAGGAAIGMRLTSVGRGNGGSLESPSSPSVEGIEVRTSHGKSVSEWWRSLPSGLEHGVDIAHRPAGEGALQLAIQVDGAALERANDDEIVLTSASGEVLARYAHVLVLDADGVSIPSSLDAVDGRIVIRVEDEHARYPLVVDPMLYGEEETVLFAPSPLNGENTGWSVALSSDGVRAVVGAPPNSTGSGDGRAMIYTRSGLTWAIEGTLIGAGSGNCGAAVAIDGDGSRVLVGCPRTGANAGAVRVFARSGSSWTLETVLAPTDLASSDSFGTSVALSGDGARAAIGASGDDTAAGSDTGSVRVFARVGTSWSPEATLLAADASGSERLGSSVALSADGLRVLAGAVLDVVGGLSAAGSGRVFVRTGTAWTEEAALLASDPEAGNRLGASAALDATGTRALLGAEGDDTVGGAAAGSARVFVRAGSTWSEEATLLAGDGAPSDQLGRSVSISASGDRALVGSVFDDSFAGSARLFLRVGVSWSEEGVIVPSDREPFESFGASVSLSGDGLRAVVGAFNDDAPGRAEAGSARTFLITTARTQGAACSVDAQCGSGFCVDGVCCDAACGGGAPTDCMACSGTASPAGTCAPAFGGVTCRATASDCDAPEACDGVGTSCPADLPAASSVTCRAAAGDCDAPESCDGVGFECPADQLEPSTEVCRPGAAGTCDATERCDGVSVDCPDDGASAAGTVCRPTMGACDIAEACDGISAVCPGDTFLSAGVVCRAAASGSAGACDLTEVCDGSSAPCPADLFRPVGTMCQDAVGACDTVDFCTGGAACVDQRMPSGIECRASVGTCDLPEACDGSSTACPTDVFAPVTAPCGDPVSGACDAPDHCEGLTATCVETFLSGVECRAAAGGCDVAEVCAGTSTVCPPDGLLASGVACRVSTDPACDPQEVCDGAGAVCPTDLTTCEASDAGPSDAGRPDGGDGDAGTPVAATGCSSRTTRARPPGLPMGVLVLVGLWVRARRRASIRPPAQ
jgi:MYXO-CTERM domain-containing protein